MLPKWPQTTSSPSLQFQVVLLLLAPFATGSFPLFLRVRNNNSGTGQHVSSFNHFDYNSNGSPIKPSCPG